jgi:hypothetical protein
MDTVFAQHFDKRAGELRLHSGFAAAYCHTAAGILKILSIFTDNFEHLIDRVLFAEYVDGIRETDVRAAPAIRTLLPIDACDFPAGETNGLLRAQAIASAASGAMFGAHPQFRIQRLPLAVATPEAAQRAPFQENRCPHAVSVHK